VQVTVNKEAMVPFIPQKFNMNLLMFKHTAAYR
jgi:hypothetical protein